MTCNKTENDGAQIVSIYGRFYILFMLPLLLLSLLLLLLLSLQQQALFFSACILVVGVNLHNTFNACKKKLFWFYCFFTKI